MSGTTTIGAANVGALFRSYAHVDRAPLELTGRLVPEPDNPQDANAIAIHVEGSRIGYLPGYLAARAPRSGQHPECVVQLWGASTEEGLTVRGWVAPSKRPIAWPHDQAHPPALTLEERRVEQAFATSQMVTEALGEGGSRAQQFRQGMVGRYHYLETVEPIKQLKREGRLAEALQLCYRAIEAAENDRNGREPAPWYTEQAAIIHRKLGETEEEVAVLRRWLDHCPPDRRAGSKIEERLEKIA